MKEPNFFIIGAPKCGTTSLAHWLSQHPYVYLSTPKEPHYFSKDFPLATWRDYHEYLSLFDSAQSHHIAVGEASVWYLRSSDAIACIEAKVPQSRYIVMLRNPVEMAPSLHWQAIFSGDEDVKDFKRAWRLDNVREGCKEIPARCRDPKLVQYRRSCRLGEQVERLYQTVGRERVLTVFLEDIEKNSHREWARILAFLRVPYWDDLDFRSENRSKHWRWPWVRDLQRFYGQFRRRFDVPPLGWGVFERLNRVAAKETEREPLCDETRHELVETFSDDIDLLARLTDRNLSHWKTV